MNTDKDFEEMTLEEGFAALDEILAKLEGEEDSLEKAFLDYEEGIRLLNLCRGKLSAVEKKVQELSEEGEIKDFEEEI